MIISVTLEITQRLVREGWVMQALGPDPEPAQWSATGAPITNRSIVGST